MVPRTFKPSKGKLIFPFFCCLAMVAMSIFYFMSNPQSKLGWLGLAFFGLATIAVSLQLFTGLTFLYVDEKGITIHAIWRKDFYAWQDIVDFDLWELSGTRMIGIEFTPESQKLSKISKLNVAVAGFHGSINMDFGKEHTNVIQFLNECLANYKK